jgi:hypothetical protein
MSDMAPIAADARDEIRTFLPSIGKEELELRARLRSIRSTASAMVASTPSQTARALAWIASDHLTAFLFAPADKSELEELRRFATRLMLTAIQAEALFDRGIGE